MSNWVEEIDMMIRYHEDQIQRLNAMKELLLSEEPS